MSAPPAALSNRLRLDVHGLALDVHTDDDRIASAIESRFRPFLAPIEPTAPAGPVDPLDPRPHTVTVLLRRHASSSERDRDGDGAGRVVYDSEIGDVRYHEGTDTLTIRCDRVDVCADLRAGHVDIRYATGADDELALAAHPLLTLPLLELFKRRGRYSLHAACVADGGRGVLLAGESGAGKTTLTVALVLAGATFLSDDMVFLDAAGETVRVLGLPDELDLTDETVQLFEPLHHLFGRPTWGGRPKHQIRAEDALRVPVALDSDPAVLFFPSVGSGVRTTVEPLPAADALVELVPNVLLTQATSSQCHLDALARLVTDVPAHRLRCGTDLDHAVATVRGVLG